MQKQIIALALVALFALPLASAATVAKATVDKSSVKAGEDVVFNAATSTPNAGDRIVSYQWNFGDGTTATGVRVTKNFTQNGKFAVTLTVIDSKGTTAKDTVNVTVLAPETTGPTIGHTPLTKGTKSKDLVVSVTLTGPAARGVDVWYKSGERFVNLTAKPTEGGAWTATIPAAATNVSSLQYYISAVGTDGRSSRLPATAPEAFNVTLSPAAATPTPTSSPTAAPSPKPEPAADTPGFGVLAGLAALGACALLLRRR